jgi:lipopolysaccharide/colanic/teichoic acid biosynthesis glycosyltransferase
MTEFPPSNHQESTPTPPKSPTATTSSVAEDDVSSATLEREAGAPPHATAAAAPTEQLALDVKDTPTTPASQLGGAPPRTPALLLGSEAGDGDSDEDCPHVYDDEAWRRIAPQGLYARLFRPILGGVLLGFVLLPVLALGGVLALANWIAFRDRAKIFFKQTRVGYRDRTFLLWKFRTMRDTSMTDYESWMEGHEEERVTPFGSFLRRSHLDELPQIINVLKGEMSFIGPRPEMVDVNQGIQEELPKFYRRLALHPGITGFAQITQGYAGNDIHAYRRKLEADLVYIGDLTFQRDLGILCVTPFWMLQFLGWQNDPAAHRLDDEDDNRNGDGPQPPSSGAMIHPMPRPGVPSNHAANALQQIDPIPPV